MENVKKRYMNRLNEDKDYRKMKNRAYYEKNKDKVKQIVKKWEENNPEKVKLMKNKNSLSYYHRKKEAIACLKVFNELPFPEGMTRTSSEVFNE